MNKYKGCFDNIENRPATELTEKGGKSRMFKKLLTRELKLKNNLYVILILILLLTVFQTYLKVTTKNLEISLLKLDKVELTQKVSRLEKALEKTNTAISIITFYHPDSRGINSDLDPSKTATMTRPIPGRTCAISSELVKAGWLGKKIYIEGHGVFVAEDRMNVNLPGKRIDICTGSKKQALKGGRIADVFCCILS